MARARLHIICGNCGCNDEFEFKIHSHQNDDSKEVDIISEVFISCHNCGTLHDLDDNMKDKDKP